MGIMVIAAYRPRPGKEARLLELTKEHYPILRQQGLVTDRRPYAMRADDATIIEVFEWSSQAAIDAAHTNPEVLKMWERYAEACEYVPLATIKECSDMFAMFEPIDLE
jgi:quinol monooxygenase YgiN